jgi:lysophospholipase L1-like esterase
MNICRFARRSIFALVILCSSAFGLVAFGEGAPLIGRVIVLGDSISYSGEYLEFLETGLRLSLQPLEFEILNLGLPSETVSGLSEPKHAGGAFPRPDLHERLDRVLKKTKPNIVIACYGMNDGIYYPFSEERFQKFQNGIRWLRERVVKSGARMVFVTPPVFDPVPIKDKTLPGGLKEYPQPYEGYNNVLDRYSEWLLSMRKEGWEVEDIHGPINDLLVSRRRSDPNFNLSKDGVHPDEMGHWLMARPLLAYFGADEFANFDTPEQFLNSRRQGQDLMKSIRERQRLLRDAWLTETAHRRPGMAKGLPMAEAQQKEADLTRKIDALTVRLPAPRITRDAQGFVRISGPTNAVLRYTLENKEPKQDSGQYLAEIYFPWKGTIQARAFTEHDIVSGAIASAELVALADHPEPHPQSAILPVTQNRDWRTYDWVVRHNDVVRLLKERQPQVLFLGDSITHYFGGDPVAPYRRGEESWKKYYEKRNALNLGFGWDRTENLLWRIQHGELEGVSPKLIVILIGTNNLETNTADEIAEGVSLICDEVHRRMPASKVLLLGLIPRSPHPDERRAKLAEVNQRIAKLDGRDGFTYLDVGSIFLKPDGLLPVELMYDYLHPTWKGYAIFAEAIEPTVARLLGEKPIAPVNHASQTPENLPSKVHL